MPLAAILPSASSPSFWPAKRNPLSNWLWNKRDKSFHYGLRYSLFIIRRHYYFWWPDRPVSLFSPLTLVFLPIISLYSSIRPFKISFVNIAELFVHAQRRWHNVFVIRLLVRIFFSTLMGYIRGLDCHSFDLSFK